MNLCCSSATQKERDLSRTDFAATGVPHSSMNGEPYSSVLFLSRSGRPALLLFTFRLPDDRLEALYDWYFMRKTVHGWEAAEGNGGPGMYERVEGKKPGQTARFY